MMKLLERARLKDLDIVSSLSCSSSLDFPRNGCNIAEGENGIFYVVSESGNTPIFG